MSEHPNVATARHMLEAFNAGRVDLMTDLYAEDGVMHLAGHNPTSGTYRGHAEIAEGYTRMFQLLATGSGHAEPPESILASDGHTMIFLPGRGERKGHTMDETLVITTTIVMAHTIDPHGKIKELWFLADDQAQYDRFWS